MRFLHRSEGWTVFPIGFLNKDRGLLISQR